MSIRRTAGIVASLAAATGLLAACGDDVESYPDGRVDYVLPFDAGGESDITARLQQQPLQEVLGAEVSISYQPGGGGALGWSELTRTNPDGYTIMGHNLPHIILQPMLRDDAGYQTEDLKQVYIFQSTPNMLAVPADSDIENLDDFVQAAEAGDVSIGGSGDYTANHLGTLMLADMAGVDLTYTPFTGTGDAVPALLGGHVDALMTYTPMAHQLGEDIRPLAVATEERMPGLEDVPTFAEQGYDIVDGAYRGVAVPQETPDEIVQTLADAFAEVNEDPELVSQFEEQGFVLENYGPREATEFTAQRSQEYEDLLSRLGML
ncbi:tripartite tricarboxylate transporter substrate binding protein [Georgenia alba]|uniref:Tripartite tricarboxylate transporter substrate binding protein n=1 Tax=Georgenia alba TaxID=2233858 RepID=A0ABW2Q9G8_9MICO